VRHKRGRSTCRNNTRVCRYVQSFNGCLVCNSKLRLCNSSKRCECGALTPGHPSQASIAAQLKWAAGTRVVVCVKLPGLRHVCDALACVAILRQCNFQSHLTLIRRHPREP